MLDSDTVWVARRVRPDGGMFAGSVARAWAGAKAVAAPRAVTPRSLAVLGLRADDNQIDVGMVRRVVVSTTAKGPNRSLQQTLSVLTVGKVLLTTSGAGTVATALPLLSVPVASPAGAITHVETAIGSACRLGHAVVCVDAVFRKAINCGRRRVRFAISCCSLSGKARTPGAV
jgi:hypothetical protein